MCYRYVVNKGVILIVGYRDTGIDVLHVWQRPHQTFRPIQASTGRVQGITSCDPGSPCVQLVARRIFGQRGAKLPCHFPFRERKFQGTKVPWKESSSYHKICPFSSYHLADFTVGSVCCLSVVM